MPARAFTYKPHIERKKIIPPDKKIAVWRAYSETLPKLGPELLQWVARTAEEQDLDEDQVNSVVAQYMEVQTYHLNSARMTEAQRVALLLGHNKGKALAVLGEMLGATKSEIIMETDEEGRKFAKVDADGELIVHEQPDWRARGDASKQLLQVHGGFAPDELTVQMNQTVEHIHTLTDAQLHERWRSLPPDIRSVFEAETPRRLGSGRGDESTESRPRPFVLDIPLHKDEGRTGGQS